MLIFWTEKIRSYLTWSQLTLTDERLMPRVHDTCAGRTWCGMGHRVTWLCHVTRAPQKRVMSCQQSQKNSDRGHNRLRRPVLKNKRFLVGVFSGLHSYVSVHVSNSDQFSNRSSVVKIFYQPHLGRCFFWDMLILIESCNQTTDQAHGRYTDRITRNWSLN